MSQVTVTAQHRSAPPSPQSTMLYTATGQDSTPCLRGDVELSAVGTLLADPGRCQILLALNDGRALPASVLAGEAGVTPSTASTHLAKLVNAGLLAVESHGRYRYYRLAGPHIGELLEVLTRLAPTRPIRSLRDGTRAKALRTARTCYDHLAGQLGVHIMACMVDCGFIVGGDGTFDPLAACRDRLSARGVDIDYELTTIGMDFLATLGPLPPACHPTPQVRYCVDWSEQRHHLAGAVGRFLLNRAITLGWVKRRPNNRALTVTEEGKTALQNRFGLQWPVSTASS